MIQLSILVLKWTCWHRTVTIYHSSEKKLNVVICVVATCAETTYLRGSKTWDIMSLSLLWYTVNALPVLFSRKLFQWFFQNTLSTKQWHFWDTFISYKSFVYFLSLDFKLSSFWFLNFLNKKIQIFWQKTRSCRNASCTITNS